jgi:hypothetical protein
MPHLAKSTVLLYALLLSVVVGMGTGCNQAEDKSRRDYFTEALEAGQIFYFSPHGGQNTILSQDGPFRLEYWNIPETVRPGQLVRCSLEYTFMSHNGAGSIVCMTVLASWSPDAPIAVLMDAEQQGEPRSEREEFSFRAPEVPGRYRLRLAMAWAFEGVQSFWGDGPQGDVYAPGVCHYSEVIFEVANS